MHLEDDLERFVDAQHGLYETVRAELRAGRKSTHWMWFVFPQLRGLGRSATAAYYGLASERNAVAYLAHPVLGARLRECVGIVLGLQGRSAHEIFGSPDDLKFRSSLTLFAAAAPGEPLFQQALDRFFGGTGDSVTTERLRKAAEEG